MPFTTLAYTLATGGAVTDSDMTAVSDAEISQRNSHYIFTEDYKLLAAAFFGATATRLNMQPPTWNAITRFNVWPPNRAVTVPSNPQLDWWDTYPAPIPQNEEFTLKVSDTANEQVTAFLWLGSGGNWNRNLPAGKPPVPIFECRLNFTTPALVANAWSGLTTPTFEQSLRGGTYAVVGMEGQGAGILAARLVFPRAPMYKQRKMRPGFLMSQALGDVPMRHGIYDQFSFGEYGRFSTFEPPQIEYFANAAGAVAVEHRMWLVWLSDSMDVQYNY
jgi:hypothetical protein